MNEVLDRILLLVLPIYILIISVFDALSIGGSFVAAVLLCMKREKYYLIIINTQTTIFPS